MVVLQRRTNLARWASPETENLPDACALMPNLSALPLDPPTLKEASAEAALSSPPATETFPLAVQA